MDKEVLDKVLSVALTGAGILAIYGIFQIVANAL